MEHQKCYVFKPSASHSSKRRKLNQAVPARVQSWHDRREAYQELWTRQRERIDNVLEKANAATVAEIVEFISRSDVSGSSKLEAGLICAGANVAAHIGLFERISLKLKERAESVFVILTASESPHLKGLLKNLISKAVGKGSSSNDEQASSMYSKKGRKLLNYDLEILQDFVERRGSRHVVVVFQDTEAFDAHILSDAVELLSAWQDRIPFIALFGIATSVESFEDRLTRAAVRSVQGRKFDVVQSDDMVEQVFETLVDAGDGFKSRLFFLGGGVVSSLLERQRNHVQNVKDFVDSIQYTSMSHFYANPACVLLSQVARLSEDPHYQISPADADTYDGLRNMYSFQSAVETLLREGYGERVKELLESDEALLSFAVHEILKNSQKLARMMKALLAVRHLCSLIPKQRKEFSAIYTMGMAGELKDSALLRTTFLYLRRAQSDEMAELAPIIQNLLFPGGPDPSFAEAVEHIVRLHQTTVDESTVPLRSEHDVRNETMRTTVVAKKIELSKQKSQLSKADTEYSNTLKVFLDSLQKVLDDSLVDPQQMTFKEVFIYDIKGPYRATWSPQTRTALERALSSPHDYLNCSCCTSSGQDGEPNPLSASQPPTTILYQLYLESGSTINASDLYSAFRAVMEEVETDEDELKAIFQRSLAELKHLGIIKSSRKKIDHIAKAAWIGL